MKISWSIFIVFDELYKPVLENVTLDTDATIPCASHGITLLQTIAMLKYPCRPTVDDGDAMGIPVVRPRTMEMSDDGYVIGNPVVRRWTMEMS